ncbi:hypothetical protein ADK57_41975 [Streptomyces sp. MMG1533]|uniref:hypothetical protein n=1 Tax=Streptomyces sp. MMG1533 TaxID=1415546 RepID=UPI0006AF3797|nr:hypothetical protein [Streptomyces sp. MMG1533]KOU56380.1 hypothetical protein ADK57_41975 [Streptomyces sp. MMG1533]
MQQYEITEAQKKAFEDNEADFRRLDDQMHGIQEAARARLIDNGWDPGIEGIPCLACPCPDFMADGQLGRCRRGGCGHPFGRHDLPR